ncbi:hypothetical protein [Bartonella sp. DGB1]|uniref:hypothetical protein n=1 Tax=Bartonella sp. DGB1 TaxID=3239807 RepID=UPI003524E6FF
MATGKRMKYSKKNQEPKTITQKAIEKDADSNEEINSSIEGILINKPDVEEILSEDNLKEKLNTEKPGRKFSKKIFYPIIILLIALLILASFKIYFSQNSKTVNNNILEEVTLLKTELLTNQQKIEQLTNSYYNILAEGKELTSKLLTLQDEVNFIKQNSLPEAIVTQLKSENANLHQEISTLKEQFDNYLIKVNENLSNDNPTNHSTDIIESNQSKFKERLKTSRPFTELFSDSLNIDQDLYNSLLPYAKVGLPTLPQISQKFIELANEISQPQIVTEDISTSNNKVISVLKNLVTIKAKPTEQQFSDAKILSQLSHLVFQQNYDTLVTLWKQLSEKTQQLSKDNLQAFKIRILANQFLLN